MGRPVRVLHLFGRMNRGGAETFIMRVYRHLDRGEVQFDFGVHSDLPGHYDDEIRDLGGRIFVLPRPSPLRLPAYVQALKGLLRREGPFGAVHSHVHFYSGVPLVAARLVGVPLRIAHSHNTDDGKGRALPRKTYRRWMRWLISRNATHMLGCSRSACEALYGPECWQDDRVRVLRYCVELAPFESLLQDRKTLRVRVGLPGEGRLVGHVGRFDVAKNHRFLVQIFEALSSRLPDARLILVGDGPLRPEVERLVAEKGLEGKVLFLGVRADVPQIMGCLDAFLFPSLWEGIPLALLEAQAAGVPCVISEVISGEVDLGLGLLHSVALNAASDVWAEHVLQVLGHSRPDWGAREGAFRRNRYDVQGAASLLRSIYVGDQGK